jgi:hypothetical protein
MAPSPDIARDEVAVLRDCSERVSVVKAFPDLRENTGNLRWKRPLPCPNSLKQQGTLDEFPAIRTGKIFIANREGYVASSEFNVLCVSGALSERTQ